jgi:hypothetical protein
VRNLAAGDLNASQQAMIQNFKGYDTARLIEPQTVPVAKMDARKTGPLIDRVHRELTEGRVGWG